MAILEVSNLGKSFGTTEVLRDISFSLEQGESLAIIGSSGSGKTTLLRCLNFLETPDIGRISVRDEVIFDAAGNASVSNKALEVTVFLNLDRIFNCVLRCKLACQLHLKSIYP